MYALLAQQRAAVQNSSDFRTVRAHDRITAVIDSGKTIQRHGDLHPFARAEFDQGRARPDLRMDRIILVLQPDAAQQDALDALLAAQLDPASPDYHRWLAPEDFGGRFGVSESDIQQVVSWLESQGFDVDGVPAGRRTILFSGTASQVESAFRTEMHVYRVGGAMHHANDRPPSIPAALGEVVHGVFSLHDFEAQPQHRMTPVASSAVSSLLSDDTPVPEYSTTSSHYITPGDFATIYDVNALYAGSIDGTGQTIAVVGRTNIKLSDVTTFRSQYGLAANNPVLVLNGKDPGIVSSGEQGEATLDAEWAGATAPKATVKLVVTASTNSSDGVALSAQYIVSNNLAAVMTTSFGLCEASLGSSGTAFWNSVWQQAAAQGITALISSGDSGAAGCDSSSATKATNGTGVNGLCSSPYSTCVGGTQFADTSNPSAYWASRNTAGTQASALSYIPEAVWNESGSSGLWSSGGGASISFAKPAWQSAPGVPADGRRDVPDVSLTAASHDGYLVVMNGSTYVFGGTSASSPSLAGLMALNVQRRGSRLGNANPTFYTLATKQAQGGAAVFHDVTTGSNTVAGVTGFAAGTGYDRATGLGSVDAAVMVNHWADAGNAAVSSFQLSASSATASVPTGGSTSVTITLGTTGGFSSAVTIAAGTLPTGVTASFSKTSLSTSSATSTLTLTAASNAVAGSYPIIVNGSGGGLTASTTVTLTVTPSCSYSLNTRSVTLASAAGTYAVGLTATSGCPWTAVSGASWITVAAGASGTGNGTVAYSVTANTGSAVRSGTLTIAGSSFSVTQSAPAPPLSLTSTSTVVNAAGGPGTIPVTATTSTPWSATSSASWLALTSGANSAAGSRSVGYNVAANTLSASRSGIVTIGGTLTYTVLQGGVGCGTTLTVGRVVTTATLVTGSVTVTETASDCKWTASSSASWLTITAGSSGTGSGVLSFSLPSNSSVSARTATLNIGGKTVTVVEKGGTNVSITTP